MTKHYLIRINPTIIHRVMWYFNKPETEHTAILGISATGKSWFVVGVGHGVYAEDCVILKEWCE